MIQRMFLALVISLLALGAALPGAADAASSKGGDAFHANYRLKGMLILSRHSIRSPLTGSGSEVERITPHKWFRWTSAPGELSLRGGQTETLMGQYFRQWLTDEGLIAKNEVPKEGEMRFYANSKQRTIATARFFVGGMLPMADVAVEHKYAPESTDLVFSPRLSFMSEAFRQRAQGEISAMGGRKGMAGIEEALAPAFRTLEKVLDMKDSPAAKTKGLARFSTSDFAVRLEQGKEPFMKGSLDLANSASDALVLQYYVEQDKQKAAFGRKLTTEEWDRIGKVKAVYDRMLFTAPSVAVNVAHPLLQLMGEELALKTRKFTFLCGHDSNIASVLAALEAEEYALPATVEAKTPIGVKFVIGKWENRQGEDFASLELVYQSSDQLRDRAILTPENPPMRYPLKFKGLQPNSDGLYPLRDVQQRFQKAIDAYDRLPRDEAKEAA